MHIPDGILTPEVAAGAAVLGLAGVALGLRRMNPDDLPKVGVMSAAFFVASLVHVPLGPTSMHLILNGLTGIVLGWAAFPAMAVALLLQSVLFGFGGLTAFGANTLNIALPAVLCWALIAPRLRGAGPSAALAWGFAAGALSIALAVAMVALCLTLSGREFATIAKLVFAAHLPVMIVEGLLTGAAVSLLRRVKPELLVGVVR